MTKILCADLLSEKDEKVQCDRKVAMRRRQVILPLAGAIAAPSRSRKQRRFSNHDGGRFV